MTTISASSTIGITLSVPSYTNPVVVNPGVTISSAGGGLSAASGSWTIQNDGTVAGNTTANPGIELEAGASVTNQSGAVISGLLEAVSKRSGKGLKSEEACESRRSLPPNP